MEHIESGYMVTYYKGQGVIDCDIVLGIGDAQELVNVAIELCTCTCVHLHCIDRGDVLYTIELFYVDGAWVEYNNNQVMGTYTLAVL